MMDLLFVDVETGGLNPGVNSLLQVGMVAYIDGDIRDMLEFSIREENYVVSAYSLEYNGLDLYKDIYKLGVSKGDAVLNITDFIKKNFLDKPVFVGHNPSIDKYFLRDLFTQCHMEMDDHISHRMIDTMSLLWGLYIAGKVPYSACSSTGAYEYFKIPTPDKHRAIPDCVATIDLFEHLIDLLGGKGI